MTRRQRFLADQEGFTLVAVTITMMVLGMFAVSAWAAANNALPGVAKDGDSKRAYEAAQAGVQWYQFQIQRDTNYWTKCADTPNSIYLKGGRPAANAASGWRNLPSSNESFAIELVGTTNNDTTCEADPGTALLNSGVLTVRSTGRFNGKVRQIVAKFRRAGFIDYIYYTKRETAPPASYGTAADRTWAQTACDKVRSSRPTSGKPSNNNAGCTEIQFRGTDVIAGPFHTEDSSVLVCGNPSFGQTTSDKIEIAKAPNASNWYVQACSGTVTPVGSLVAPSKTLELPKNNLQLATQATYTFSGSTCLRFNGTTMTVFTNQTWGAGGVITCAGTSQSYNLGPNTVIWIANNGTCTDAYDYIQNYNNASNCGDVAVQGSYTSNVTIGAEDDIIVTADLTHPAGSDAMMGLVANQFVRVYHPVSPTNRTANQGGGCSNNGGVKVNNIDAAILATQGSFLTDNWDCGSSLGNLNVDGAITQYWRGAVGTSGGNGYTKAYVYDPRLRYREPPNFLDPTTALWGILRQSEQSPVQTG
jgi:type II secretory pathway pseudopilin PulG